MHELFKKYLLSVVLCWIKT